MVCFIIVVTRPLLLLTFGKCDEDCILLSSWSIASLCASSSNDQMIYLCGAFPVYLFINATITFAATILPCSYPFVSLVFPPVHWIYHEMIDFHHLMNVFSAPTATPISIIIFISISTAFSTPAPSRLLLRLSSPLRCPSITFLPRFLHANCCHRQTGFKFISKFTGKRSKISQRINSVHVARLSGS